MQRINLWGKWEFELDSNKKGIEETYFKRNLSECITLPTTTSEAKKGSENQERNIGYLTDPYLFEGYAWYAKELVVSEKDLNKTIQLVLERTRISHVWLDENYIGSYDSLCTSHVYDLSSYMTKTHHKLTVMVDNTGYPTRGGHMTSPDTQTNWNGILGEISLHIYERVYLSHIRINSNAKEKSVTVRAKLNGKNEYVLNVRALGKHTSFKEACYQVQGDEIEFTYCLGEQAVLWSEYTPVTYELVIDIIEDGKCLESSTHSFGIRAFKAEGSQFKINGETAFLRGKHEGLIFPLTGYAPMDVEEWKKVMHTAKFYGINHYRCHTCCPPEAAFIAADELGIYLEPELPFWGTIISPEDENHNEEEQAYLINEGYRILDEFGNHPSFVMMSLGNELWGSQQVLNTILGNYKAYDDRHLYTQGSNNFQFSPCILENDDFFCGVRFSRDRLFRGSYAMCDAPQGHIQMERPNTVHDYDEIIRPTLLEDKQKGEAGSVQIQYGTGVKKVDLIEAEELIPNVPVLSHEIGQYEVFPCFEEIEKYVGVLKPRNLGVFKERLEETGFGHKARAYFEASGKLAMDCYKNELEAAFRSHELAGFQVLDLQDFSGQGTALVGVLDAFMESKGLIEAKAWRAFCSDTVLMARFKDYVCHANEAFEANIEIAYYRPEVIRHASLKIEMLCSNEKIYSEEIQVGDITCGHTKLHHLVVKLPTFEKTEKIELILEVAGTEVQNHYTLWCYPESKEIDCTKDLLVSSQLEETCRGLEAGQSVLFFPPMTENPHSIEGTYCTNFWNYPMFKSISESVGKPIPIGTMGLLINNEHPALKDFASETYTTPQWFDIVNHSRSTILDGMGIEPIVQTIDNFERNHMLGLIYEVQVAKGKLLVCTAQLNELGESRPAKWLVKSLVQYVQSEQFAPSKAITLKQLKELYTKES